jgi:drug/metabolite transporter (DMT)-like permease
MHRLFFRTKAHLAVIGANLIYGLNFSIAKSVMPDLIRPLALVSVRSVITAALFWITSLFLPHEKVAKRDLLYIFGCSFLGVVINQVLFLAGLNLTTPVNSSIILVINPVAAFVFAALILGEKISFVKSAGLITGLAGILMLILSNGKPELSNKTFLGDLYTLINTLSWALFTVVIKKMLEKYSPVTVMKWTFFFGMFTNIPLGYSEWSTTAWAAIDIIGWLAIGFVVIFATYLGYLLLLFGLKRLSPTIVSTYTYTQPVIAGVLATFLGQDTVTPVKVLSAAMIFAAVFLVSRQRETA